MLKLLFFFTLIIISLPSCFRYDYSKYHLYSKPNGIIYQGEKEGLQVVLKDIKHIDRYKPEGTATLIITCQSKPKTDTFQVNIDTEYQSWRYHFSCNSIVANILLKGTDLDVHIDFSMKEILFRNMNFATFYRSDSVVIDENWDIVLKRIPPLIER